MIDGEVWILDDKGGRLLYPAGSPEAAKWLLGASDPHDLDPATDTAANDAPDETPAEDEAPPTDPGPITDADSPADDSVAEPAPEEKP